MSVAILEQGQTAIRDAVKTLVTHVCLSTDSAAFLATHTGINPTAGTTSTLVKATASETNVDFQTVDYAISIDGTTEFTGLVINSIGVAKGVAVRQATGSGGTHTNSTVGTDCLTRSVRGAGLGIGVQAGDVFSIGPRLRHEDNS